MKKVLSLFLLIVVIVSSLSTISFAQDKFSVSQDPNNPNSFTISVQSLPIEDQEVCVFDGPVRTINIPENRATNAPRVTVTESVRLTVKYSSVTGFSIITTAYSDQPTYDRFFSISGTATLYENSGTKFYDDKSYEDGSIQGRNTVSASVVIPYDTIKTQSTFEITSEGGYISSYGGKNFFRNTIKTITP